MAIFYDSNGRKIQLGEKIGSGGEGNVYKILSENKWVAKIYHQSIDATKQQKIKAMLKSADKALKKVTAWPLDSLHKTQNGAICGFIMPDITGYEPVHHIYSPSHRKQQFPELDWAFLVNICRNTAAAFGAVHDKGHVIGDVNPNLVFVSKQSMVTLIDCDSFQITSASTNYPCEVGVAHFTPPELQALSSFKDVERTKNHDNFGLSLLIFHLLMMGRHPFSGIYSGKNRSLEQSIQAHLYAFSDKTANKNKISPPPNAIKPEILSDKLQRLFEKSFSEFGSKFDRPSAKEWVNALDTFAQEIKVCQQAKNHKYYERLSHCPWCQADAKGAFYFPPLSSKSINLSSGFNKDSIWKKITALPAPKEQSLNIEQQIKQLKSTVKATKIPKSILIKNSVKLILSIFIVIIWFLIAPESFWWSFLPATYLFVRKNDLYYERKKRQETLAQTKKQLQYLLAQWQKEASPSAYNEKFNKLKQYYQQYNSLDTYYTNELKLLQKNKRKHQLNSFLEKFYINNAVIRGIGVVRKADLASFGIETAADIEERRILSVSGFGAQNTKKMLNWRKSMEKQFVFNPSQAINPNDISRIKIKVFKIKIDLENKLSSGYQQLKKIHHKTQKQRKILPPKISIALKDVIQAQADCAIFKQKFRKW